MHTQHTQIYTHIAIATHMHTYTYRIRGIIGESNIWRFALKMQLAKLLIGSLYCMEKTHAYSLNGVHLVWQNLRDFLNRQIKTTAKYTTYMV